MIYLGFSLILVIKFNPNYFLSKSSKHKGVPSVYDRLSIGPDFEVIHSVTYSQGTSQLTSK